MSADKLSTLSRRTEAVAALSAPHKYEIYGKSEIE